METKRDIRARILEKRTHMTQEEWEFKSDLILKRLMEHPFFVEAREIYCYMDYRREVGTRRIIEKAWELNKKTAVPKVCGDDMEFYYVQRFDELEKDILVFANLSRKRRRKVTRCLCSYLEVRLTGIGTGSDMEKDFMINIS